MGGHAYWYYAKYQPDLNAALQALREQEFQAGRYNPVIWMLDFPISEDSPTPGAQHPSIEAALEASEYDGTRSILDIFQVSDTPYRYSIAELVTALQARDYDKFGGFQTAFPLASAELVDLFGTEQPTHEMVESVVFGDANPEASGNLWSSIGRGTARYIIVYAGNQPSEIFFIGYSFD
ncbi:hypothetical protein LEP3755_08110 [Leptolyngbya sp. NIES-3755]|nr:hypothetical protein LEP3755_08110 [Leptolyngbya sp. NIES-3755]